MTKRRKRRSAQFKFEVALEAAKGLETANQIASEREVHPNQISQWKKQLLEEGVSIFSNKNFHKEKNKPNWKWSFMNKSVVSSLY